MIKIIKKCQSQGSSLEFMAGNKVVLETVDTITVNSDTNNSIDASLTIMRLPNMALTRITKGVINPMKITIHIT